MSRSLMTLTFAELMSYIKEQKHVAWALFDNNGALLKKGGDEQRFGLHKIDIGKPLDDSFLCLEGVFPLLGNPYEVYELELSADMFVNIYCLPTNEGELLVIQDITESSMMKKNLHGKTQQIIAESKKHQLAE